MAFDNEIEIKQTIIRLGASLRTDLVGTLLYYTCIHHWLVGLVRLPVIKVYFKLFSKSQTKSCQQ